MNFPGILQRSMGDVNRVAQKLLLFKVFVSIRLGWWLFPWLEPDLIGAANHVTAPFLQPSYSLAHLVPDAPKGVISEEFHHVARREELVADGQLTAVAGR